MEFPPIMVINLDTRPDRWEEITKAFQSLGWPALQRISAIRDTLGWKGCLKSHLKCLEIAKEKKFPWVLVLEDDCLPTQPSLTQFNELLPTLSKMKDDYDIFLGGCTFIKDVSIMQYKPPLFSLKGLTTHFCLYSSGSYNKLINKLQISDVPIDALYNNDPSIRMICTVPYIATQVPGKSDIENNPVDYTNTFSTSEKQLFEISQGDLEGFLSESNIFNNKVTLANVLMIGTVFSIAYCIINPMS